MKALIIDDEVLPAKMIDKLIKKHCFEISQTAVYNSPDLALKALAKDHFDLIFLDVEMPEMDAFQFLKKANLNFNTVIIFTTAYSNYAVDAFRANASYYIMKPVTKDELIKAIRKANWQLQQNQQKESNKANRQTISIYEGDEYSIIPINEIIRIEADGSYSLIYTAEEKHLSSRRLGYYEQKLEGNHFFRCHNSHLINLDFLDKIGKSSSGYLKMKNGETIPFASSKRNQLNQLLGL